MSSVEERYRGNRVRVFALNRDAVLTALRTRAQDLVASDPNVLEVRLFGSLARNEALPGSDADLMVVLGESSIPFRERGAEIARRFSGAGIGCDVFAYTREELEKMRREGRGIVQAADRDGVTLASRSHDSR